MIDEAVEKVSQRQNLSFDEMNQVMDDIMSGNASDMQIAALLTGLTTKHATIDEIAGAANSMRAHAVKFPHDPQALDIVGTGGDKSNSFNISTTAALIIASLGIPVIKHGNRAASSKSGAADVLEALGINIHASVSTSEKMLKNDHFCFLFAQKYHPAMRYVAPVRQKLHIKSIFNVLGPLTNPSHINNELMGVYSQALLLPLAKVLDKIGVKHADVIYGEDCLDEVSISAPTQVVKLRDGVIKKVTITPEQFGFKRHPQSEIVGGDPKDNAQITKRVLNGVKGAPRNVALLNAGMAISLVKPNCDPARGIKMAAQAIDSGQAKQGLMRLTRY